ncbi:MAG: hypothetical protein ACXWH0_01100 [Acidimicrobiia bacterium]
MRNVRSALVGLGTLIILLTFVGFATFSPDVAGESRSEGPADEPPAPLLLAADAGATTGRVTAFVFASQLQTQSEPNVEARDQENVAVELTVALLAEAGRRPHSATTTTAPPTTTTAAKTTTTTTARPAATTTTTAPPTTTLPPEPTTATTAPPSGDPLTENEMRTLASQYFPGAEVDKAVLVARCESNYDPSAYNPAGPSVGLYQHRLTYWDSRAASAGWAGAGPFDAAANTAVTAWLVARDGWGHWPYCSSWADGQLGG